MSLEAKTVVNNVFYTNLSISNYLDYKICSVSSWNEMLSRSVVINNPKKTKNHNIASVRVLKYNMCRFLRPQLECPRTTCWKTLIISDYQPLVVGDPTNNLKYNLVTHLAMKIPGFGDPRTISGPRTTSWAGLHRSIPDIGPALQQQHGSDVIDLEGIFSEEFKKN